MLTKYYHKDVQRWITLALYRIQPVNHHQAPFYFHFVCIGFTVHTRYVKYTSNKLYYIALSKGIYQYVVSTCSLSQFVYYIIVLSKSSLWQHLLGLAEYVWVYRTANWSVISLLHASQTIRGITVKLCHNFVCSSVYR